MAQAFKLAKKNAEAGRVKGKALFESENEGPLLNKEVIILSPGEKATVAPGHTLTVCASSLQHQYIYHTRSKATLTGPLVYHVQPCTTLSLCQRIQNTVKISAVFAVFAGAFAFFMMIAACAHTSSAAALLALALAIVSCFMVRHAVQYGPVDDTISKTKDVLKEIEQLGCSVPTVQDQAHDDDQKMPNKG